MNSSKVSQSFHTEEKPEDERLIQHNTIKLIRTVNNFLYQ